MILDNAFPHVVSFAKVDKSRGFSTLELSNMIELELSIDELVWESIMHNALTLMLIYIQYMWMMLLHLW